MWCCDDACQDSFDFVCLPKMWQAADQAHGLTITEVSPSRYSALLTTGTIAPRQGTKPHYEITCHPWGQISICMIAHKLMDLNKRNAAYLDIKRLKTMENNFWHLSLFCRNSRMILLKGSLWQHTNNQWDVVSTTMYCIKFSGCSLLYDSGWCFVRRNLKLDLRYMDWLTMFLATSGLIWKAMARFVRGPRASTEISPGLAIIVSAINWAAVLSICLPCTIIQSFKYRSACHWCSSARFMAQNLHANNLHYHSVRLQWPTLHAANSTLYEVYKLKTWSWCFLTLFTWEWSCFRNNR